MFKFLKKLKPKPKKSPTQMDLQNEREAREANALKQMNAEIYKESFNPLKHK